MDNQLLIYAVIGAAFLINLIIILAFRIADKKDRTLKNVNNQIKNFRTEVSTTVARVNSAAKDCEVNIQSRVEQANTANSKLAESLDMLMVHQKELSELEYICKSYKVALEKLKGQTEQAEARILAVQAEVRKAEGIKDFTIEFQSDTERLTNQMQDLKAEYVRLIASTEQSLREAGQKQLEENNRSLVAFSEQIDSAKGELGSFTNNEKIAIQEMFNQQEIATQRALDSIDDHSKAINASLDEAMDTLDSYKKSLEDTTSGLEDKKANIERETEELIAKCKADLESTGEATANTLESRISDKEDEMNSSFELYSEKLQEKEAQGDKLLNDIETRKSLVVSSFDLAIDNKKKEVDALLASLENEKELYSNKCQEALDKAFKQTLDKAQSYVSSMKDSANEFVERLADRINEARETYAIVNTGAEDKIAQAVDALNDLAEKLKTSQSTFDTLGETITKKREELYEINKEEMDAKDQLDKIYDDMQKAKEEAQEAKEARINEEARVVRLKFMQSSIKKDQDDSVEEEEIEEVEEVPQKKNPEDMIEEFPDDLEYVDLGDDEDDK